MLPFNKKEFPLLAKKINGTEIVYLDSAATSQKPIHVIEAEVNFYKNHNAPVHRTLYDLGEQATIMYENARKAVANFINARQVHELIFTKGTTESINFVAATWGERHLNTGDEIVLTELEHHANIIPWQQLAIRKKITIRYIPVTHDGTLNLENIENYITQKTKLVAVSHISNAFGVHVDVQKIVHAAHKVGAKVLIDAAQSAPHGYVDVQKIDCDFLAFSGHKMLGPTGIGVLYMRTEVQRETPPYQFGGGMVFEATFAHTTFLQPPQLFEAGTPAIAQAIGLAEAIRYLQTATTPQALQMHGATLCTQLINGLEILPGVTILGPIQELKKKGHMVAFKVKGLHAHDIAAFLSSQGICVRAGHHCAQPLHHILGAESSIRASFYGYNTQEDVGKAFRRPQAYSREN